MPEPQTTQHKVQKFCAIDHTVTLNIGVSISAKTSLLTMYDMQSHPKPFCVPSTQLIIGSSSAQKIKDQDDPWAATWLS